jgi:hypothetical protein
MPRITLSILPPHLDSILIAAPRLQTRWLYPHNLSRLSVESVR